MISSILLVLITIFVGFTIDESPIFIFIEFLINVLILADFLCRVKLVGIKKFIEGGLWNIFDGVVVIGCVILFFVRILNIDKSEYS